ncbi:uncharacterized protein [Primulina eburnea]|uniref:uncharacterized protein n=1 Tax=Primulina eburnea TaxID=1245227 RepID=UPI003C6C8FB5
MYRHEPREEKTSLEQMMSKFISSTETRLQNQDASIKGLENQIRQLVKMIASRDPGTLPSNTETNPKEKVKAIAFRNGKVLEQERKEKGEPREDRPTCRHAKMNVQFGKLLEVFKKLHINIPFDDVLMQMPSYAKFLKDILTNKRKLEDHMTVSLTENCSALLYVNLGASINLMTLSIFRKLILGEPKPTRMSLKLANRSVKYPRVVIEEVLVKVDKFIFPAEFLVLDMEKDMKMHLILGRLFFATGKALIDVQEGKLRLRAEDEEITFDVFNALKHTLRTDECFRIDALDSLVKNILQDAVKDPLEGTLTTKLKEDDLDEEKAKILSKCIQSTKKEDLIEYRGDKEFRPKYQTKVDRFIFIPEEVHILPGSSSIMVRNNSIIEVDTQITLNIRVYFNVNHPWRKPMRMRLEDLGDRRDLTPPKSNIEEPTTLELKPLPAYIKYVYLDAMDGKLRVSKYDTTRQPDTTQHEKNQVRVRVGWIRRYMTAIVHYMIENFLEIFMDDFSIFGATFDECLQNLNVVLKMCEETNLVLNGEKCHFMIQEEIVLGHKISEKGIEVDKSKVEVIKNLTPPASVKGVRSIREPKGVMVTALVLVAPDWDLPFEVICNASDMAVGAILGQRWNKVFHTIYYASKTLDETQLNYATTENELFAVIFALDKFHSYIVLSKVIVFTDHSTLKYLLAKKEAKPRFLRWILLLQEFDLEIKDVENVVADHLSKLEHVSKNCEIDEIDDWFWMNSCEHMLLQLDQLEEFRGQAYDLALT